MASYFPSDQRGLTIIPDGTLLGRDLLMTRSVLGLQIEITADEQHNGVPSAKSGTHSFCNVDLKRARKELIEHGRMSKEDRTLPCLTRVFEQTMLTGAE